MIKIICTLVIIGIYVGIPYSIYAQNKTFTDSVFIEEVRTYAKMKKFQAATKTDRLNESDIDRVCGGLEQLLMNTSSLYVKSDAGTLSSIRFRGTSPNQTSVFFGGIDVNSLTLGQSNLCNITPFLFDYVDLQFGSSSTVNGSGSVGGAIHLGLDSLWREGIQIKAKISEGSYGEQFYGTKIYVGNGKLETISRIYYYYHRNDFSFINNYTGDVEHPGSVKDYQHGASLENYGFIQELNYRFGSDEYIKSSLWYEHDYHQIPLNMSSNYIYQGEKINVLVDKNFRFWSEYQNNKGKIKYTGGLGFVHDMEIQDNNQYSKIGTDRFIISSEIMHDIKRNFGYKAGLKYKCIYPKVYAYSDSIIKKEQHFDLYCSFFYHIGNRWKLTANMRELFVTNFSVPFTPSVGAEYLIFSSGKSSFIMTGSIAKSYRIPTFNDRYWGTNGNPDLKAENGMNYEAGWNYHKVLDNTKVNLKLNVFYLDIKNWIEWRQLGILEAVNVGEVVSKGIEFQSFIEKKEGESKITFRLNYTFNPVKTVKDISESLVNGLQMEYKPRHMGNVSVVEAFNKWEIYIQGQYTGTRLSDGSGTKLHSYFLINTEFFREIYIDGKKFKCSFSFNNILNRNYQNQKYYAMPRRTFRLSISANLKSFNK